MKRGAPTKMSLAETIDYIDDTVRLMANAAKAGEEGKVKFYAGYVRSATRRQRQLIGLNRHDDP